MLFPAAEGHGGGGWHPPSQPQPQPQPGHDQERNRASPGGAWPLLEEKHESDDQGGGTDDGGLDLYDKFAASDLFDFDQLLLDPADPLLADAHPRRSVSAHDGFRGALLDPPPPIPPRRQNNHLLDPSAYSDPSPAGGAPSSTANYRFEVPPAPGPAGASSASMAAMPAPPALPRGVAAAAAAAAAPLRLFQRSCSTRDVSDLRRSRDRYGGVGGGATPFQALKSLAQRRAVAAAATATAAASGATGSAPPPSSHLASSVRFASVLSRPSAALLSAVRAKGDIARSIGRGDIPGPGPAPAPAANNSIPPSDPHPLLRKRPSSLSSSSSLSSADRPGGELAPPPPPPAKRAKVLDGAALHRACCRPGVTAYEVFQLLQRDPTAAGRREAVRGPKVVYDRASQRPLVRDGVPEPYSYPLNLAISHRQAPPVLDMLMNVAPDVLVSADGAEREGPLAVLLKHSPSDVDSVDRMLLLKPRCVAVRDRAGNTPLHVAATRPTSLDAVRHLCILYPEALRMRNRHGLTPLGLALQRTAACPDDVATFLLEQQQTTAATRHRGA